MEEKKSQYELELNDNANGISGGKDKHAELGGSSHASSGVDIWKKKSIPHESDEGSDDDEGGGSKKHQLNLDGNHRRLIRESQKENYHENLEHINKGHEKFALEQEELKKDNEKSLQSNQMDDANGVDTNGVDTSGVFSHKEEKVLTKQTVKARGSFLSSSKLLQNKKLSQNKVDVVKNKAKASKDTVENKVFLQSNVKKSNIFNKTKQLLKNIIVKKGGMSKNQPLKTKQQHNSASKSQACTQKQSKLAISHRDIFNKNNSNIKYSSAGVQTTIEGVFMANKAGFVHVAPPPEFRVAQANAQNQQQPVAEEAEASPAQSGYNN